MSVFITPDILESLPNLQQCKKDIAFFKNLKQKAPEQITKIKQEARTLIYYLAIENIVVSEEIFYEFV